MATVRQQLVERLKALTDAQDELLFREVAGAANLKAALENTDNQPGAYVFAVREQAQGNITANGVLQPVNQTFAIVIMVENFTDDFGADSSDVLESLRREVRDSILGFQPAEDYGQAFEYVSGQALSFQDDLLIWQDNFLLPNVMIMGV